MKVELIYVKVKGVIQKLFKKLSERKARRL